MSEFKLEIVTPEHQFMSCMAQAVTFLGDDGEITVLKGHQPMVANVGIGELKIKINDEWKSAFAAEGFLEVRPDEVLVFVHACEWPENIDAKRAQLAIDKNIEKLKQKQSLYDYRNTQITLARQMARLRVKNTRK